MKSIENYTTTLDVLHKGLCFQGLCDGYAQSDDGVN